MAFISVPSGTATPSKVTSPRNRHGILSLAAGGAATGSDGGVAVGAAVGVSASVGVGSTVGSGVGVGAIVDVGSVVGSVVGSGVGSNVAEGLDVGEGDDSSSPQLVVTKRSANVNNRTDAIANFLICSPFFFYS